LTPIKRKETLN